MTTRPHTLRSCDLPILFSGAMIRAILREIEQPGTGKTQTRRILKPQPWEAMELASELQESHELEGRLFGREGAWIVLDKPPRFAPGDLLWCRESWRIDEGGAIRDGAGGQMDYVEPSIEYAADCNRPHARWRPSIHMPRWASRLTLEVTAVKVERLNDISEEDAKAEGIDIAKEPPDFRGIERERFSSLTGDPFVWRFSAARAFADLWTSINGPGSWLANPWIVAVSFKPHPLNIDQIRRDA